MHSIYLSDLGNMIMKDSISVGGKLALMGWQVISCSSLLIADSSGPSCAHLTRLAVNSSYKICFVNSNFAAGWKCLNLIQWKGAEIGILRNVLLSYILAVLSCEFHRLHMVYIWKWGSNTNRNRPQISKVLDEIKMFLVSEKEQDGQEKDFHTADHRREESTGEENQQNFIFLVLVWKVARWNQIINESWFMSSARDELF